MKKVKKNVVKAPPQKSDAQLVDELEAMRNCAVQCFPNPLDQELEKRKQKPFLESKTVLLVHDAAVGATSKSFETKVLKNCTHGKTITTLRLQPNDFGDDNDDTIPTFDFKGLSPLLARYLPALKIISITYLKMKNFALGPELKSVETLKFIDPTHKDDTWSLHLPNLKELCLENYAPPPKQFAESLVKCPKIDRFFSHKYWEDALPALYLPNCKDFTLRRADCMRKLSVYLPRVTMLNLDACYDLTSFSLLKRGHKDHAEFNLSVGKPQSKFNFSCLNALLGDKVVDELTSSGRLLNKIHTGDDEDDMGMCHGGFPTFGGFGGFPDMNSESDLDSDDESEFYNPSKIGQLLKVKNLKSRPELNGKLARVVEEFWAKQRFGVRFEHDQNIQVSIKFENCDFIEKKVGKSMEEVN